MTTKRIHCLAMMALALALTLGATGCRKGPKGPTPIPGQKSAIKGPGPGDMIDSGRTLTTPETTSSGIPTAGLDQFEGRPKDYESLKSHTVYFDFDRYNVKASERGKAEAVASYLSEHPGHDLLIEGHCDERGTEGYNLSLGEKRAQSLREYLANLGVSPGRVRTLSLGESQPADPGHNEAAWAKNRRGVFVVLLPRP
jgi:peptidoglycan-associated lipoprotein